MTTTNAGDPCLGRVAPPCARLGAGVTSTKEPEPTASGAGPRSPRFPATKFSVPKTHPRLVQRPKLLAALDRGTDARLTLVVGSPGAGKTVLLADWLGRRPERPAAWLSCDVADADPVRFVAAVIESLRRVPNQEGVGDDARQLLSSDGGVSADVISALADDLEQLQGQQVLVVDDFHLTGEAGPDALGLLVEHRPLTLQLVLATRLDPPLRLSRMRAHEELVELRDRDLSFSRDEAKELLSSFGVELAPRDLDVVHERSEGWAAGLQMAAISIQGSPDPAGAAGRVELHRRSVAGYFLDEVLYRQPPEVVRFMLATSVLDELSVAACSALCGEESAPLLRLLYSSNMFVTVTDDETGTYRYHQLIKEVLRAELHVRDPLGEQNWLKRAAEHLAGTGQVGPAVRDLIEAGEPAAAFRLLSERVVVDYATNPALGSTLDLDAIHPDLFAGAPQILVPLAADLLLRGAFERGSRAFTLAQQTRIEPSQEPELALRFATVSSMYHGFIGELDQSLAQQDRARQLAEGTAGLEQWLVTVDTWAMYCHTYLGNFTEARRMANKVAAAEVTTRAARDVMRPGVLSQAALAEGDLAHAGALATEALDAAHRLGFEDHYFAFTGRRTQAQLALERHDLPTAGELTEGLLIMPLSGRPIFDYLAQLDRARIWAARGNLDEALASLPAARTALKSDHSVLLAQADELEAHFCLALGERGRARRAAEHLPPDRRTVMSAIMALDVRDLQSVAATLRNAPAEGPTPRSDLELRLLKAATALLEGAPGAPDLVRDALAFADRGGFVQSVLETAPLVLEHLISNSTYASTGNIRALISAGLQARKVTPSRRQEGILPDPLTGAERRLLEMLPQRLSYIDMATDLQVSLNTVKTHLRHTYMKLGANSRSSAIRRATALGLL